MKTIIEMAREAGLVGGPVYAKGLEAFAALVEAAATEAANARANTSWALMCKKMVADEREACAKVCEDGINNATDWDSSAWDQACENRAYAIRARGQA
jgi:hypothetical protein